MPTPEERKYRYNVILTPWLDKRLRAHARQIGEHRSVVIRRALTEHLDTVIDITGADVVRAPAA